jgi:molybdopterin converting factor small subunit
VRCKLEVRAKLFATLSNRSPKKLPIGDSFAVELEDNSTILDLLAFLSIIREEAKIVMINHTTVLDYNHPLKDGDIIAIFPPVGGG